MATTSGVNNFNYNASQISKMALRKIGAIASGETPDNQTIQDCLDQLNMLVKALNATGLHVWTEEEATLFLQPSQTAYTLGGTTTDQAAWTSFTSTSSTSATAGGATSIQVLSATGFAASYNVGLVLDSGTIFWTTVASVAGKTINLNAATTGTSQSGQSVYVFQNQIARPLRVISARRYNFASAIETPMAPMLSRLDYRNLPNKTSTGTPTQAFYDPRGGANTQGILNIWPAPSDVTNGIKFTWWRSVQDFTAQANTPDLPTEWIDALVWNLAYKMAPEYDVTPNRYEMIKDQAASSLDNVEGWDREIESYNFGFDATLQR